MPLSQLFQFETSWGWVVVDLLESQCSLGILIVATAKVQSCNEFLNISSPLTIGPATITESMVWAKDCNDKELRYQLIQRPEVFRCFNHVESWIDVLMVFTLWYKLYLKRPDTLSTFCETNQPKFGMFRYKWNPWSWRELIKLANRDTPT